MTKTRLVQASELAQLAAGLAHAIRNPLHLIRLNLFALSRDTKDAQCTLSRDDRSALFAESNCAIDRVEKLLQELIAFANHEPAKVASIDIVTGVQTSVDSIRHLLKNDVRIRTSFPKGGIWVRFDSGHLQQILLDLFLSAEQQFDGPGTIDICVSTTRDWVTLTIADDGPGVSEADQQRVFEPFYFTRPDGTGLGLTLAKRFVDEAGGTISCRENRPKGTVFQLELPRARKLKK